MNTILNQYGFEIVESVYSNKEIDEILDLLNSIDVEGKFGIREFLLDNLEISEKVFNPKLRQLLKRLSPKCDKSIKSIYFDKPPSANWVVNWHQDLTINVSNKIKAAGYKNWRVQKDRTIVQPDQGMLESIFTIRVHLDNSTIENGALRVIEESHKKGVVNIKNWIKSKKGIEKICEVNKGGVLIMKPLTLHSSRRTENDEKRRVIHIEFTDRELPSGLRWNEKLNLK